LLGRKGLVVWLLLDFLSSIRKAVVGSLYSWVWPAIVFFREPQVVGVSLYSWVWLAFVFFREPQVVGVSGVLYGYFGLNSSFLMQWYAALIPD
jgi:hypothetical protein